MAEQYYQIVNGRRVEITGDDLTAKKAEWQSSAAEASTINLEMLRSTRNQKLAETDWWELPSQLPISDERTAYRQALRDITDTYSSLEDVVWPAKPE